MEVLQYLYGSTSGSTTFTTTHSYLRTHVPSYSTVRCRAKVVIKYVRCTRTLYTYSSHCCFILMIVYVSTLCCYVHYNYTCTRTYVQGVVQGYTYSMSFPEVHVRVFLPSRNKIGLQYVYSCSCTRTARYYLRTKVLSYESTFEGTKVVGYGTLQYVYN